MTILQAWLLKNNSKDEYACYPILIHSGMFYYIAICDDKRESTVPNNATAPLPEKKKESHNTSLYPILKLISGYELYVILVSLWHEMLFCCNTILNMNANLHNDLL